MKDIFDRNGIIHLAILALVISLSAIYSWWFLLLYPAILIAVDILYYFLGICIFDPDTRVQRGYSLSLIFHENPYGQGLDYGFNFYNGNYSKDRRQAQIDKFEYAIAQLGLKPGMSLIDIGCGCGDWLSYLQSKGMNVVGVNITGEQVKICQSRGLDVVHSNWKEIDSNPELKEKLYGKFDAVTFWDTVEHYVPMKDRYNVEAQNKIYSEMFQLAYRLFKPESESHRVFISCLHQRRNIIRRKWNLKKLKTMYYCYLLDAFHNGYYPDGEIDQLHLNAKPRFILENRLDTTQDYYMTSIIDPTHFGIHKFNLNLKKVAYMLLIFLTDYCWIHRIIWFRTSIWMWQFDKDDITQSDMVHWWLTFKKRSEELSQDIGGYAQS